MKFEIGSVFTEVGETKCHYLGKYENKHFAYSEGKSQIIRFLNLPKNSIEVSDVGINYLKERYPSKGQYFIGTNDKEYIFICPNPKDPVVIEFIDVEKREELMSSILFVKSIVEGKFDLETKNEYEIIHSKNKLFPVTTSDLIRIGLTSFKRNHRNFDSFEIIDVGAVVSGKGYYHEIEKHFKVSGLLIKYKNTLVIGDESIESEDIGFFATEIKLSDLKKGCPFNFDEAYCSDFERVNRIGNGIGDHVDVSKVLVSRELVKKELENIDLEYYQKKI